MAVNIARQPGIVVAGLEVVVGIEEDVVRIDERDDQEKRLLPGGDRGEVRNSPLPPGLPLTVVVHEPAIVVGVAAAGLVGVLIGAGILRVPAGKAVFSDIALNPVFPGRLGAVPLSFVNRVEPRGRHHSGDVGKTQRQFKLGILLGGHIFFERILDPVLGREKATHQGRSRR